MQEAQITAEGARALVVAALLRAARDVRRGLPCDGRCMGGAHICADDARAWLAGPGAEWLDLLGITSAEKVRRWVAR